MSKKEITILSKRGLLDSEGKGKLVFCGPCVFRKQIRLAFLQPHIVLKLTLIIFILICRVFLEFLLLGKYVIC